MAKECVVVNCEDGWCRVTIVPISTAARLALGGLRPGSLVKLANHGVRARCHSARKLKSVLEGIAYERRSET